MQIKNYLNSQQIGQNKAIESEVEAAINYLSGIQKIIKQVYQILILIGKLIIIKFNFKKYIKLKKRVEFNK